MMKHGSLFSGIGGFDLAASWMGWDNIFYCEKDPFCRSVLSHHWPETDSYEDIFKFNATKYRGHIDIISGGFPCQPFSQAGRRKGKADDRYLWPETRQVIMEARPEWIVLENVAGLFTILEPESISEMESKTIELFCTDSEQNTNTTIIRLQRRVIGSIISELRTAGYLLPTLEDGTPVVLCIPACAVNAPHRRDRVWFVAHAQHRTDRSDKDRCRDPGNIRTPDKEGSETADLNKGCHHLAGCEEPTIGKSDINREKQQTGEEREYVQCGIEQISEYVAYAGRQRLEGLQKQGHEQPLRFGSIPGWDGWPTQSPICGGDDGISRQMDGITFPKWRTESIKAYGNAIVPQVALEIFRAIHIIEQNIGGRS